MTVDTQTGFHIPKDPAKFSFDDEVTPVFNNMAVRSLPMYDVAYNCITEIVRHVDFAPGDQVWDFGVSTGRGLKAVRAGASEPLVDYYGCDVSQPMLDFAAKSAPWAQFIKCDFNERGGFPHTTVRKVKVAIWGWTLQFLPDHNTRRRLLKQTYDALEPGGVLFLMEKWSHAGATGCNVKNVADALQRQYLTWRRDNGYTAAEIVAKTEALKGSMWPWARSEAEEALVYAGFDRSEVYGLYQMFNFGGFVAVKS